MGDAREDSRITLYARRAGRPELRGESERRARRAAGGGAASHHALAGPFNGKVWDVGEGYTEERRLSTSFSLGRHEKGSASGAWWAATSTVFRKVLLFPASRGNIWETSRKLPTFLDSWQHWVGVRIKLSYRRQIETFIRWGFFRRVNRSVGA